VAARKELNLDSIVVLAAGLLPWQGAAGETSFEGSPTLPLPRSIEGRFEKRSAVKISVTFLTILVAMQMPPSPIDRLSAALRALRQAYAGSSDAEDKTALGAKCLHVLIAQLAQEGLARHLSHGIGSREAKDEYRDFTREVEAIPAS
jgi:hypothetical protein